MCTVDPLMCQHYDYLAANKVTDCEGKCGMDACKKLRAFNEQMDNDFLRRLQSMDGQTLLSGTKKDEGKARWELLPFEVIDAVARILTKGAKKYADRNWEKGIAYGRVYAGVMRHLAEWWICKLFGRDGINHADGEESHIDHAICGLMFLSAYEKRGMTELDDRPFK